MKERRREVTGRLIRFKLTLRWHDNDVINTSYTPTFISARPTMTDRQRSHDEHRTDLNKVPLSLWLHDFYLPTNVGSLFRLADALGLSHLYLSGQTPHPPNDKLRRAARSTEKHVPFSYHTSEEEVINILIDLECCLIGLELTQKSQAIERYQLPPADHYCLVLGNEKQGLSTSILANVKESIHIPMHGHNSSMNVVTACAIATHALANQLR